MKQRKQDAMYLYAFIPLRIDLFLSGIWLRPAGMARDDFSQAILIRRRDSATANVRRREPTGRARKKLRGNRTFRERSIW
jgi:hypothetical protein